MAALFVGDVKVKWLDQDGEDRDMELLAEFSFQDSLGKKWTAPKGAKINGASIPRIVWRLFGTPYIGDYRRASVIHDYYCHVKTESSKATHRMFHDACIVGGVSALRAKIMYAAVVVGGGHWEIAPAKGLVAAKPVVKKFVMAEAGLDSVAAAWIEKTDPTLDEIDNFIASHGKLVKIPA